MCDDPACTISMSVNDEPGNPEGFNDLPFYSNVITYSSTAIITGNK